MDKKIILNIFNLVKNLGSTDFKSYGVSSHNVVVESAPLLDYKFNYKKIKQIDFKRYDD